MNSTARRILGNGALSLLALVIAFSFGEFSVRMLYKDDTVLFPRYHTDYQYGRYKLRGIRPDSTFRHTSVAGSWEFVTNNKGFRNTSDFDYAKPSGTLRILSLGDSQTQGYEVRQDATFSAVLERYLANRKIKAEVLNAGVSGYSTAEALALLENEGYKYSPDVVLLGFYANDFADNAKAGLFELDAQGFPVERKFEHLPGVSIQNVIYAIPPVRWLSENSYFYSLLFNSVWNAFKSVLRESATFEYAVANSSGVPPEHIALAGALIERMHRYCRERDIRFIVLDIPVKTGPYQFGSSLPPALAARLDATGVEVLTNETALAGLNGAAEVHVPYGHNHISGLTHTLLGISIGNRLTRK